MTVVVGTDLPRPPTLALAFVAGLTALAALALLSLLWAPGGTAPVHEAQRGLLYAAAAAAALLLLARGGTVAPLLGGLVAGAVVLALYGLATRLFPGHVGGAYDPSSGYQLAEPIGYWNALGLVCALGVLLAAGLAARGGLATRVAAGVALVPLLAALSFTFSRGALAALAAGVVLQVALHPRRARLLAAGAVLGAPAVAGVLYASRFHALTTAGDSLTTAQREGRQVAVALVVLAVAAAAAAALFHAADRRLALPAAAGRSLVATAAAALAVGVTGAVVAAGGPVDAVDRATASFRAPLAAAGDEGLEGRLLSVSGNGRADYWEIAWDAAREHPLLGVGAGGYEAEWLRERPVDVHARDAHNLYLETLAELGPLGLALLAATLALPLLALLRLRRQPLAAAAGSAYAAFLLHAAVDWDWELPVVTLPALLSAAAIFFAPGGEEEAWLTGRRRGIALALAAPVLAVALVAHVGNRAAASAADALDAGEPERAVAEARRAATWAPWSEEPWVLRADAELDLGDDGAARRSLDEALARNPESAHAWLLLAELRRPGAPERARRLDPLGSDLQETRTDR